jgi:hypothetical protein
MITVSVLYCDIDWELSGTYTPGQAGRTEGPADSCYPAEEPMFELEAVRIHNHPTNFIKLLSEETLSSLESHAIDKIEGKL